MFLDGDSLRLGLSGDLGFAPEARAENIRLASEVSAIGYSDASVVLCSFISPYTRDRDYARSLMPEGHFFEIYTKCDLKVLKRRDPKGLYAKALSGKIKHVTGITATYEKPENAEIVVDTNIDSPDVIVEKLLTRLEDTAIIPRASWTRGTHRKPPAETKIVSAGVGHWRCNRLCRCPVERRIGRSSRSTAEQPEW